MEPGDQLASLILETSDPVFFIENKLQYLLPTLTEAELADFTLREKFETNDVKRVIPSSHP